MQMQMTRVDQERREEEARRQELERKRQEQQYQINNARKEEEMRKRDNEFRARGAARPVPHSTYANANSNPVSRGGYGLQKQNLHLAGSF